MKCELTVSVLPLLLFPFANFVPEGGRKGDPGNEVAPLQILLIPLCNALVLVCFSAILGPFQTPLHSCAEPNSIRFDFGVTLERRLIQTAYLHRT